MKVLALQIKTTGSSTKPRNSLYCTDAGLRGGAVKHSLRQLLLIDNSSLSEFNLPFSELGGNVLLGGGGNLYDIPSGTRVKIGSAVVSLTYLCEPCKKIAHLIKPAKLLYQRGYLARVVSEGHISLGDPALVSSMSVDEAIPHDLPARIAWFLSKSNKPLTCAEIVDGIGLSRSYCRAIPAIVRKSPIIDSSMVKSNSLKNR